MKDVALMQLQMHCDKENVVPTLGSNTAICHDPY